MNKIITSLLLTAAASLAHAQAAPPAAIVPSTDQCSAFARTLVGKPYDQALAKRVLERKLLMRVVARDKAQYPVTLDYNAGRINVQLQKDVIAGASCG